MLLFLYKYELKDYLLLANVVILLYTPDDILFNCLQQIEQMVNV